MFREDKAAHNANAWDGDCCDVIGYYFTKLTCSAISRRLLILPDSKFPHDCVALAAVVAYVFVDMGGH